MIKKNNNIRFGKKIYVVEQVTDNSFLLKNLESKVINWVSKKDVYEALEKIDFQTSLFETAKDNNLKYQFKNKYLTINIKPTTKGSVVSILEENTIWAKPYEYNTSRTRYEFGKFFNYTNELTPYKLKKNGFKKIKG